MTLKFTCGNVKMFLSVPAPTHSIHFLLRGDLECRVRFSKYRLIFIAYLQVNVSQLIGGVHHSSKERYQYRSSSIKYSFFPLLSPR